MKVILRGRCISKGTAEGHALVTSKPISFLGSVDPKTGTIIERTHELKNQNITNKIIVFPFGKGSTVGSYVLFQMKKIGTAPKAIINYEAEPIVAIGAIISNIPLIDKLDQNPIEVIKTNNFVRVNATEGTVEIGE